jgi:hypothetical protein
MKKTKCVLALTLFLAAVTLAGEASAATVNFVNETRKIITLMYYRDAERDQWQTLLWNPLQLMPGDASDAMIDDIQGPVDVQARYDGNHKSILFRWSGMEFEEGAVIHLKENGEFSYE